MKKKTLWAILAATAAVGTGLTIYLLRKRRNKNNVQDTPRRRDRHFTKAFAKAKEYADGEA